MRSTPVTAAALAAGFLLALPLPAAAEPITMIPDPASIDTSGNSNLSSLGNPQFDAQALDTLSPIFNFVITDGGTADLSPCSVTQQCFLYALFDQPVDFALGGAILTADSGGLMAGGVLSDYDVSPPTFLQMRFNGVLPTSASFYVGRHGPAFIEGIGVEKVDVAFVPEPSSLLLLGAACGLLAALPRRSARLP